MSEPDAGGRDRPSHEGPEPEHGRNPDDTVVPGPGSTDRPSSVDPFGVAPGASVGRYKLLSAISEGGMGKVWLAERRDTFQQRVALKFAKFTGADPRETIARFEQEREVLAALNHEHIAKIFDGGIHMDRPWFAMEYVDGLPISEFCDRKSLSLRERLVLFRQVCDAVTHAHRRGILHRDLKPSNILVTLGTGREPRAKVIDFGIAKALTPQLTDHAITRETRAIGTFEYMSPEQADPRGIDLDTRTDVYSLGIVLYELLAGVKPFDLERRAEIEAQRIIREEDPPTPSVRLSTIATRDSGAAQRISRGRRDEIESLIGALRRELEWIPLMAIRKDRERRYGSAEDLSRDIGNYLEGLPLVAAPESRWYLVRKFARRHQRALAAACVVLLSLAATTVVVSVALVQRSKALVERERALALAQRREAELMGVIDFQAGALSGARDAGARIAVNDIVEQASIRMRNLGIQEPERARRLESLRQELTGISMAEVLRRSTHQSVVLPGIESLESSRMTDDQLRSLLLMSLAQSQWSLGFPGESRRLFADADRINQRVLGPAHPRALWSRMWVARTEEDPAAGARIALEVEAARAEAFGAGSAEHLDALRLRRDMEALSPGLLASAIDVASAVAEQSEARGPGSRESLDDAIVLGELLWSAGARTEAKAVLVPALEALRAPGRSTDLRVRALITLGRLLAESGEQDRSASIQGIQMLREAKDLAEDTWGSGHPLAFQARGDLASCLAWPEAADRKATEEAVGLLQQSFEIDRRLGLGRSSLPFDRSTLATIIAKSAFATQDANESARALVLATEALDLARERLGRASDLTLQIARATASTYALCGSLQDAESLVLDSIATRAVGGETPGSMPMLLLAFDLARVVEALGRRGEAIRILEDAQAAAQRERPADSESRWFVSTLLLGLLEKSEAELPRLDAQRREVDALRAAAAASQQHGMIDWRSLPWRP
jgi:serine/threonine protein kinase